MENIAESFDEIAEIFEANQTADLHTGQVGFPQIAGGALNAQQVDVLDQRSAKMLFEAVKEVRPNATAHCGRAGEGKRTKDEIGISALRLGGIVGIHEVHICTESQRLTLRHEASDRGMFADGALEAAKFLVGKPAGLYNMENLLENR